MAGLLAFSPTGSKFHSFRMQSQYLIRIGVQKKASKGQKPAMRLLASKKKQKILLQVGKMPSLTYRDWPSDKPRNMKFNVESFLIRDNENDGEKTTKISSCVGLKKRKTLTF